MILPRVVCAFITKQQCFGKGIGRYRYSASCRQATLYSSCYAAMARHLLGDSLSDDEKASWIAYLNSHQDDDGLYRDPTIDNQGWYTGDPLWCGRPHLACHVITALACLGGVAARPLRWLESWRESDALIHWLDTRDWSVRIAFTGNEIMNIGTLLQ